MKPFHVYILRCSDGSYYTGHTDSLDERIAQHHLGVHDGYTASRRPVELVFAHAVATRIEALTLEMRLKGWSRGKKAALIRSDWAAIHELARCRTTPPRPP